MDRRVERGQLGKRIDDTHGDRDFYAVEIPASAPAAQSLLKLQVSALPTTATCVILYKPGFEDAVGQYCGGRPGRDISISVSIFIPIPIPILALDPGRYLLVVLQDVDSYGGERPPIQESISDSYTVLAASVAKPPEPERSANEQVIRVTSRGVDRDAAEWTKNPPARIGGQSR